MAYYTNTHQFIFDGESLAACQTALSYVGGAAYNLKDYQNGYVDPDTGIIYHVGGPYGYGNAPALSISSDGHLHAGITFTGLTSGGLLGGLGGQQPVSKQLDFDYAPNEVVATFNSYYPPAPTIDQNLSARLPVPTNTPTLLPIFGGGATRTEVNYQEIVSGVSTLVWDVQSAGVREVQFQIEAVTQAGVSTKVIRRISTHPGVAAAYVEQNFNGIIQGPPTTDPARFYFSILAWQNSGHSVDLLPDSWFAIK